MKFTPCRPEEVKTSKHRNGIRKILSDIIDSNEPCVEIKDYPHRSAEICYRSLRARITKDQLDHLRVSIRDNRVFVINTLLVEE